MSAADMIVYGIVLHLVADWLLQNEWMAVNKVSLTHPAAYVHSGIHGAVQLLVFPWWAAALIGVAHLLIDTRKPLAWWSEWIEQTQPNADRTATASLWAHLDPRTDAYPIRMEYAAFDLGTDVRIWADQVAHIAVIAIVAVIA